MIIRHPKPEEVETILALFAGEVRAGRMLPRTAGNMLTELDTWLVADKSGEIAGCVSLVHYDQALCEVRSLAVHSQYRRNGVARQLVGAALALAQEQAVTRVLTLTRAAALFEQLGFQRDFVDNFPEKVWRDCAPCPFRAACDEVALLYDLQESQGET